MVNNKRLAIWVIAVVWRALWVLLIGGTISALLARNGDGFAAIGGFATTIVLMVAMVISRTRTLARVLDRAAMKQAQQVQRTQE